MNLAEFFLKYNGKFLDSDGAYGNQCVDVIRQYFKEVLEVAPVQGNAIDYFRDIPGFTKIKKSLFAYPKPGDIVIFNIGQYGHIAVCNWVRTFDMGVFEQNNPIGSPCHYGEYNYSKVVGWLRPEVKIPKVPLKIARLGIAPDIAEFNACLTDYSAGKVSVINKDYGMFYPSKVDQELAYKIVDQLRPQEKFVFIFFKPGPDDVFYSTYYYPKLDCMITTCPGTTARLLAFEFSHQLQMYYNVHRGSLPYVEVVDSNFPNDDLIRSKFSSVSSFYQK